MRMRSPWANVSKGYGTRARVAPEDAWLDDDLDPEDTEWAEDSELAPPSRPLGVQPSPLTPRSWKERLASVDVAMQAPGASAVRPWPSGRELVYLFDVVESASNGALTLGIFYRDPRKGKDWTVPRPLTLDRQQAQLVPDPADRRILGLLEGGRDPGNPWLTHYARYGAAAGRHLLPSAALDTLIPLVCATGRCRLKTDAAEDRWPALRWDDRDPWVFSLGLEAAEPARGYVVTGSLHRDGASMDVSAPLILLAGGVLLMDDCFARLDDSGAFPWIAHLRQHGPLRVPFSQGEELLARLYRLPRMPRLEVPRTLRYEEIVAAPGRRLRVRPGPLEWGGKRLLGELHFEYAGVEVSAHERGSAVLDRQARRLLLRDAAAEQAASEQLHALGFKPRSYWGREGFQMALDLAPRNLPRAVAHLVREGWRVEAEGKLYRQPGAFSIEVTSGVDWFELHGTVEFGDTTAKLPELLAALRRGETTVLLDDGTYGVLPEEWLRKYGVLAGLGSATEDHLRFGRSQVGLLDALLASLPEARYDATLARARQELHRFEGIQPSDPPEGFAGRLRAYQRDGLGWLCFLQQFGFGGCLADDMGLGKTVQVLALLESRREQRERNVNGARPGPSLIVVPRSLVFNWKQEAARFTPKLRMLDHTGAGRLQPGEHFDDHHVVLTTYGTLRHDAIHLKDVRFDCVILDEAQAIKNASSESAKAARLLVADHRLALSGTPVQNHLGELWSLFEFLNPGMLGSATAFSAHGSGMRMADGETRALLARALRPFILRRTKEQVARDLPVKTEQTLFCELDAAQRRLYDELRHHYRVSLLGRIGRDGIGRSKIQILEALLRLRQAACHPGLLDGARRTESSAKLDALLPQLAEVGEEGHKALVFSQFTSLLDIVRARLDRAGMRYEYLDGKTRDRAACVERFQRDPDCLLFLVSLRAGGLGLNLTAAEYVFLLDPWWNPAVEAQAIDRTHRIGQTRPVFAYRLIAKDTVEEKVLELQETKRQLADAIIAADEGLIRTLTREDLELLLS
jgi:superfamily II DNA or RNA helicase